MSVDRKRGTNCPYSGDPEVVLDLNRFRRIIVHLVKNARESMDRGLEGQGEASHAPCLTIKIEALDSARVRIGVVDNGAGIASQDLTDIFQSGHRKKESNGGFGLHDSAYAASEIGGRLYAESEGIGRGATFWSELPL